MMKRVVATLGVAIVATLVSCSFGDDESENERARRLVASGDDAGGHVAPTSFTVAANTAVLSQLPFHTASC